MREEGSVSVAARPTRPHATGDGDNECGGDERSGMVKLACPKAVPK